MKSYLVKLPEYCSLKYENIDGNVNFHCQNVRHTLLSKKSADMCENLTVEHEK